MSVEKTDNAGIDIGDIQIPEQDLPKHLAAATLAWRRSLQVYKLVTDLTTNSTQLPVLEYRTSDESGPMTIVLDLSTWSRRSKERLARLISRRNDEEFQKALVNLANLTTSAYRFYFESDASEPSADEEETQDDAATE